MPLLTLGALLLIRSCVGSNATERTESTLFGPYGSRDDPDRSFNKRFEHRGAKVFLSVSSVPKNVVSHDLTAPMVQSAFPDLITSALAWRSPGYG